MDSVFQMPNSVQMKKMGVLTISNINVKMDFVLKINHNALKQLVKESDVQMVPVLNHKTNVKIIPLDVLTTYHSDVQMDYVLRKVKMDVQLQHVPNKPQLNVSMVFVLNQLHTVLLN